MYLKELLFNWFQAAFAWRLLTIELFLTAIGWATYLAAALVPALTVPQDLLADWFSILISATCLWICLGSLKSPLPIVLAFACSGIFYALHQPHAARCALLLGLAAVQIRTLGYALFD